jgi:YbgC/YbaW family acyl-CoA thioester hydrolase
MDRLKRPRQGRYPVRFEPLATKDDTKIMKQIVERKIMWGDLDSLGIVFYPKYYEWADACAHLFFESIDLRLDELWKKRKLLFGLIETSSQYNSPGRYHESIKIITEIERLAPKTVAFKHTIVRGFSDTVMLTVREKRICMDVTDPENIRAVEIPSDLYSVMKKTIAAERFEHGKGT